MTYYAITVDTEEEWQWNRGWPTGSARVSNIGRLPEFQEICDRFGAAVTYFANYAVMKDSASRKILLTFAAKDNVEIGMHIHPWNTPPIIDTRGVEPSESFLANLPDHLLLPKLETVYRQFATHGLTPTSFRGGRYSSGGAVHDFLRKKRFLVDASVVPFTRWPDRGAPDYRHRHLQPVRHGPRGEGDTPLWEIPVTMGFSRRPFHLWQRIFDAIDGSALRSVRLIGIMDRLNLVRRVWLNFEDPLGRHMLPFLHMLRSLRLPCICFTFHSSSLEVGANGCYTQTERKRQALLQQIENVLKVISTWDDFQPATVSMIGQGLEEGYEAAFSSPSLHATAACSLVTQPS